MKTLFSILFALFICVSAFGQTHTMVDVESNQSVTGNKTFTGTTVLSGPTSLPNVSSLTDVGTLAVTGLSTLSGGQTTLSVTKKIRDCTLDGTIDTTGAADSSATINTCIANAKAAGQNWIILPSGNLLINTSINATNYPGLHISGSGVQANVTNGPVSGTSTTMLWCNTGSTTWCLETVGSKSLELDHLTMTLCCGANMGAHTNFSRGGILQGRDNAAGGGNGPFCFSEQMRFHDIYITDNGGGNSTFNGSRGQVGIYDVGAENDQWDNIQILSGTPLVISQTDIIGSGSTYQTLQTGCPASMVGAVFNNPVFVGSVVSLPCVESNITNKITMMGVQAIGCASIVKWENNAGSAPTTDWFLTGEAEVLSVAMVQTTVPLDNMFINLLVQSPPPPFDISIGANNLALTNNKFLFGHLNVTSATPFINNTATGTTITGGVLQIGGTTSASNTTVTSSQVWAPGVTDANITFNAASNYDRFDSTGISTSGTRSATQFLSAAGTGMAVGYGFAGHSNIGWYLDSNLNLHFGFAAATTFIFNGTQLGAGSANTFCFSSSTDPGSAGCDTGLSRNAAGVISADTSTIGNGLGKFKATDFVGPIGATTPAAGTFTTLNDTVSFTTTETTAPTAAASKAVCYADSTAHALECSYNNGTFFQIPQVIKATSAAFATATTAGTCVQNTTAVTGATTAMAVNVSPVSTPGVGAQWSAFVSSAGNVTINECAVAVSAGGSIAFNIRVTP